ncbi:hypothetical protein BS50DRAFT_645195 [Corynespora cassiicola Philippines]|uniref:Uncharacterized protein n=1 Tax=Corynespora cassiicola Philippines TaxID=1448308 RepID=A0A2T2NI97_CORCC|nr:hypothetical protein BS50DRAFT_645195 [Corynespora cassiicola Philippines]
MMLNIRKVASMLLFLSVHTKGSSGADSGAWQTPVAAVQPLVGPPFEGHSAQANPMRPKTKYSPFSLTFHRDSGNTRAEDYPGPLGRNIQVSSAANIAPLGLMWDDGRLTTGAVYNETTDCIVALDPETFDIKAKWTGPTDKGTQISAVFFAYSSFYQGRFVTAAVGPRIIEIERTDINNQTSLELVADRDLSDAIGNSTQIFNTGYDGDGNLWFTTGALGFPDEFGEPGDSSATSTSITIGYISPSGTIRKFELLHTAVENTIAISGSVVYVVTGPAGESDHVGAVGHLYALEACSEGNGIKILFKEEYDAGDSRKPGGTARGSGSSPGLLGDEYISITDNANGQINALFFKQAKNPSSGSNLVCKVPLFTANASSTDNAVGGYFNGETYSIIATNMYNGPEPISIWNASITADSPSQKVEIPAPGIARVDFDPRDGSCKTVWEVDVRATGIPILSTASGIVYQYAQDHEMALTGSYVWYLSAIDYRTGELLYRVRVGAGGLYNNNYSGLFLGPDGAIYAYVTGGVVKIYDGVV